MNLHRTQSGLSLIEIMISLLLGSLLSIGIIRVFSGTQASNSIIMGEARLTENSRFAADALAHQLRLTGLRTTPELLPALVFDSANPAVAGSNGTNQGDDETRSATVVIAGSTNLTLPAVKANTDTVTVRYQGLDDQTIQDCLGQDVLGNETAVDTFFVAAAAATEASEFALYCQTARVDSLGGGALDANGAVPISSDTRDLQVLFGEDTDGDGVANRFLPADDINLDMTAVIALQLTMVINGARPLSVAQLAGNATTTEADLQRSFQRTISLRNLLR